jgi:hypothetical protein
MTATVAFCPPLILQFFGNNGLPLVGGSVLTQVGGTNTATYQDSGGTTALPNPIPLNSRGEISNSSGQSQQLFLIAGSVYTFTIYDAAGNQIDQAQYVGNSLSGNSLINATLSGTTTNAGTISGGTISGATITGATITSPTISSPNVTGTFQAASLTLSGALTAASETISGAATLGSVVTALVQAPATAGAVTGNLDLTGNAGAIGAGWRIDATDRLVNPGVTQPQFMAQLTANQTSGNDIIWNNIPAYGSNRGATPMLNTSTGVATAPVGGDYLLTCTVNVKNNTGGGHQCALQIARNGSNIIPFFESDNATVATDFTATFTALLTLAVNDTIKVTRSDAAWSGTLYVDTGCTFSMRLLG